MKKFLSSAGCLILAMQIQAQDIIVNLCAFQDTQAVSLDVIEVFNESNGSSMQINNLPQNTTMYEVNLSQGGLNGMTGHAPSLSQKQGSVNILKTDAEYRILTYLNTSQDMHISGYNLSGQLFYERHHVALKGENVFIVPAIENEFIILQVRSKELNRSFKVGRSFIGEYADPVLYQNSSGVLKSASSFSYNSGDRIHFTVSKSNIQSRKWMGQPENEDIIRIAVPKNNRVFDMAQTLSKGAQEHTISYSGVAFYTGCFYASTFYPPGKVADYFGFQYFRDNDQDESGHNTDFLTKAAYHTIHLLDDDQLGVLIDLAEEQDSLIAAYAYARMPIIKAFHRYLEGDIPTGKTHLSKDAVVDASKKVYLIDGELSYGRARAFSTVIKSFTQDQKDYLYALNSIGMQMWEMPEKPKDRIPRGLNTHVMTNASEMFSWFLGSIEADTYFCPERQGTYFGGFFMKDAPAMGNAGYAIDMETTADKGRYMLENILDNQQEQKIRSIYSTVLDDLDSITAIREVISIELRRFWEQDEIDKQQVLDLSEQYGEYDGRLIYTMADQFVDVSRTLTSQQLDTLIWLRELEDFPCIADTVFLYSKEIEEPVIKNTDSFFE